MLLFLMVKCCLKCYTCPLIFRSSYTTNFLLPFIWMGLQIQTWITWEIFTKSGPRSEGTWWEQRPQECLLSWGKRSGSAAPDPRADSQFNTLHKKSADWVAFPTGLNTARPELFQAGSQRGAIDTNYNHFIRKRRAGVSLQRLATATTEDA
jgi:hypothetical protein